MRHVLVVCSVWLSFALSFACGGTQAGSVVAPLTPEQIVAFDHGVDFVTSLEGIEGRWRNDWDRDLEVRVASADLIAAVTVRTLRSDTDPTQRVTYRLVASIDRTLIGDAPKKELELAVQEEQTGYLSVRENMGRIADKQYVAYIKRGADNTYSWHLSPASEQVLGETEAKITQLNRAPKQGGGERVIVHTN